MCNQSGEVVGREKKFCNTRAFAGGKKNVEGEVLSELVVFDITWKSVEKWSWRIQLTASLGMQLSCGKPVINFTIP